MIRPCRIQNKYLRVSPGTGQGRATWLYLPSGLTHSAMSKRPHVHDIHGSRSKLHTPLYRYLFKPSYMKEWNKCRRRMRACSLAARMGQARGVAILTFIHKVTTIGLSGSTPVLFDMLTLKPIRALRAGFRDVLTIQYTAVSIAYARRPYRPPATGWSLFILREINFLAPKTIRHQ